MKMLVPIALLLAGCSFSPSADFMKALGQDQASVCVKIHAAYMGAGGEVFVARTAIVNGTLKCNADGVTVTSGGATDLSSVPTNTISVTPAQPKP